MSNKRKLKAMQRQIDELIELAQQNMRSIIWVEQNIERLDDKLPLKTLDQSVFDGLDAKWLFLAVSSVGSLYAYTYKPKGRNFIIANDTNERLMSGDLLLVGRGYDATNWQNSLIERDSELTGDDLTRAMIERGDQFVMCAVSDSKEIGKAITKQHGVEIIHDLACLTSSTHPYIGFESNWKHATPIDNNGNVLTAKDVGL